MGCWHETCFVSHLPIFIGDECYAVLMAENSLHRSQCYPYVKYVPLALAKGIYNDYGSLKKVYRFDEFKDVLKLLPDVMVQTDNNKYISYDLGSIQSFTDLINLCNDGKLYIKVNRFAERFTSKRYLQLNIVFVKPECVDLPVFISWGEDIDERISGIIANVKTAMGQPYDKNDEFSKILHESGVSEATQEISEWVNCQTPDFITRKLTADVWMQNPVLAEFIYGRLMRLTSVLASLRMSYHIPSGKGSLEAVTPTHLALAELYIQESERDCD